MSASAWTLQGKQPVIFCDFDGTITLKDNIVAIMEHFNPPGWQAIVKRILSRELSVQEGVGQLFRLLPSTLKDDIARYVQDTAGIRAGFSELLTYCREHEIPFYVTSGGVDFFLYPLLEPFQIPHDHIYCNESDFSGETIEIVWPHTCDEHCSSDCGMCKPRVMRRFPPDQHVRFLIGDSLTDFEAAKLADHIFARSHLAERCRELGYEYTAYETFFDVISGLQQRLERNEVSHDSNHA
ncbi:2-hydroxy-3-keto-5-methylthiopentenyl-1-phosphate phosphatase [Paenibacillus turpanensis]|uniref:2-hydroxy-3-keto-5-methylthiopentenyl-1- phosphate phosphatase n=1 Tax=Paenibacillus turpanensis TaxID=2689078 RepID=UPI001409CA59|nr:2-hydroxy-3-keto-5-methylthiopentenyl-1-phosphate phosphatase [Paenibacillus turpanensis]